VKGKKGKRKKEEEMPRMEMKRHRHRLMKLSEVLTMIVELEMGYTYSLELMVDIGFTWMEIYKHILESDEYPCVVPGWETIGMVYDYNEFCLKLEDRALSSERAAAWKGEWFLVINQKRLRYLAENYNIVSHFNLWNRGLSMMEALRVVSWADIKVNEKGIPLGVLSYEKYLDSKKPTGIEAKVEMAFTE
jgi:hypothetical protein